MKKERYNIIKYATQAGDRLIASAEGDMALIFIADYGYIGTIFNTTHEQLKDIMLFMEYDPDVPNYYLADKYGFEHGEDIFITVMHVQTFFEVLIELGVIKENQLDFERDCSLEEALMELF